MAKKRALAGLALLALLMGALLTACGEKDTFTAQVLQVYEGGLLVEPAEGSQERNSADKISVHCAGLSLSGITPGSAVKITYDGVIAESYPAQITAKSVEPAEQSVQ